MTKDIITLNIVDSLETAEKLFNRAIIIFLVSVC
jgi:hypothetical protein